MVGQRGHADRAMTRPVTTGRAIWLRPVQVRGGPPKLGGSTAMSCGHCAMCLRALWWSGQPHAVPERADLSSMRAHTQASDDDTEAKTTEDSTPAELLEVQVLGNPVVQTPSGSCLEELGQGSC